LGDKIITNWSSNWSSLKSPIQRWDIRNPKRCDGCSQGYIPNGGVITTIAIFDSGSTSVQQHTNANAIAYPL
jgi:hypothetical protein